MSYFAPPFLPGILIFFHVSFTAPMASQRASSQAPSPRTTERAYHDQSKNRRFSSVNFPLDVPFPHPTVASASTHLCPQQQVLLPPPHSSPGKREGRPNGLNGPEKSNPMLPVFTSNLSKGTAAMTERASQNKARSPPRKSCVLLVPPRSQHPSIRSVSADATGSLHP